MVIDDLTYKLRLCKFCEKITEWSLDKNIGHSRCNICNGSLGKRLSIRMVKRLIAYNELLKKENKILKARLL